jgi:hypothetical protein
VDQDPRQWRGASLSVDDYRDRPMTSLRQLEANRDNAQRSTGPRTNEGKRVSRRNALRHGLAAETVIEILEDPEDYKAFEAKIIADYHARTAVERELVLRLASLLWRIRRATAIETDLLRMQAEILRERVHGVAEEVEPDPPSPYPLHRARRAVMWARGAPNGNDGADGIQNDAKGVTDRLSTRQHCRPDPRPNLLLPAAHQSEQRGIQTPQPL